MKHIQVVGIGLCWFIYSII